MIYEQYWIGAQNYNGIHFLWTIMFMHTTLKSVLLIARLTFDCQLNTMDLCPSVISQWTYVHQSSLLIDLSKPRWLRAIWFWSITNKSIHMRDNKNKGYIILLPRHTYAPHCSLAPTKIPKQLTSIQPIKVFKKNLQKRLI